MLVHWLVSTKWKPSSEGFWGACVFLREYNMLWQLQTKSVMECPWHQIELWQLLWTSWDWHSAVVQATFSYLLVWYYTFELQMTITNSVTVRDSFTDWRRKGEVKVERNVLKPGKSLMKYLIGCLTAEASSEGCCLCWGKQIHAFQTNACRKAEESVFVGCCEWKNLVVWMLFPTRAWLYMYLLELLYSYVLLWITVNISVRITVNFDTSHSIPTAEIVEC